MFKRIVRIFLVILIFAGLLWLGGTSFSQFGNDIEIKNPLDTFESLIAKLGIDFSFLENQSGSIIVDAQGETFSSESSSENSYVENSSEENNSEESSETILSVTNEDLNRLVSKIRVSSGERKDYNRDDFEKPVKKYQHNGKSYSRHDYAWLTSEYLISEEPFQYLCPYTGLIVEDEEKLDYEHCLPLSYCYRYGDIDWTKEQMNEYSYDQSIGFCVWYKANRSHSDRGPADWLPDVNIEDYCYTWLCIAEQYDIALRQEDINICKLMCKNAIDSGLNLKRID